MFSPVWRHPPACLVFLLTVSVRTWCGFLPARPMVTTLAKARSPRHIAFMSLMSKSPPPHEAALPQAKAHARAAELTAVALDLFEKRGFAAVTIKNIGEAAGVNSALIYYYFKDKEDLFRASIESAVDQAFEHFRQLRERHDNPADVISDWLDTHVELYQVVRKMVKVSLDYAGSAASLPSVDASIRRFYDQESEILTTCVRQGIERGIFHDTDPQDVAVHISTFLDGAMVRSNILPDFKLREVVDQFRRHLWARLGYQSRHKEH